MSSSDSATTTNANTYDDSKTSTGGNTGDVAGDQSLQNSTVTSMDLTGAEVGNVSLNLTSDSALAAMSKGIAGGLGLASTALADEKAIATGLLGFASDSQTLAADSTGTGAISRSMKTIGWFALGIGLLLVVGVVAVFSFGRK